MLNLDLRKLQPKEDEFPATVSSNCTALGQVSAPRTLTLEQLKIIQCIQERNHSFSIKVKIIKAIEPKISCLLCLPIMSQGTKSCHCSHTTAGAKTNGIPSGWPTMVLKIESPQRLSKDLNLMKQKLSEFPPI